MNGLTATSSGFVAQFNGPLDGSQLNSYGTAAGETGQADVTLVGNVVGRVAGSLVVENDTVTFLSAGGPLLPDNYTVTLRSGLSGFQALLSGVLLDGNADGTAGDDFVGTLAVGAAPSVMVSLPAIVRGPGQSLNLSATQPGWPVRLSEAAGVTSVTATIQYNPAQLTVSGASLGQGAPAGASVTADTSVAGVVTLTFQSPTPLAGGPADIARLTAEVPPSAAYGTAHVVRITSVAVNQGAIAATGVDSLQLTALLGDTTGSGSYSGLDAQQIARLAVQANAGFAAFPAVDPRLIGDVTGNGRISSYDAYLIASEGTGRDVPQVPPLPAGPQRLDDGPGVPRKLGPTVHVEVPADLTGGPGNIVVVPVKVIDDAGGIASMDVVINYNTTLLDVRSVIHETTTPGTVDNDGSPVPSTTVFEGNDALESDDDVYNGQILRFTSGALSGQEKVITDYDGLNRRFTFASGFTAAPTHADAFNIIVQTVDWNITPGDLWAGSGTVIANVDEVAGRITATVYGTSVPGANSTGSLLDIEFVIMSTAPEGTTAIDLESVDVNEGSKPAAPVPVAGPDATDGVVAVEQSYSLEFARTGTTTFVTGINASPGQTVVLDVYARNIELSQVIDYHFDITASAAELLPANAWANNIAVFTVELDSIISDGVVKAASTGFVPAGNVLLGTLTITAPTVIDSYDVTIFGSQLNKLGSPKGTAALKHLTITVTANQQPTITDIANQQIAEDGNTGALTFTVGDAETPAANLVVTGSSSNTALVPNANIVFGGSGANRTVTVTPLPNQFGSATITVTVTDANSGSAQDTFLLTVTAVNDLPTGSVTIDDTTPTEDQVLAAGNSLADVDGLGAITYTWKWADDSAFTTNVTTLGTGATFTPGDTAVGKYLRVTASYTDGNGTAESVHSAVTAAVANVNDLPTGSVTIDDTTPTEDQLLTAANTLADADGLGAISYTWQRADDVAFTINVTTLGTGATFTPGDTAVGKYLRVTAGYTDGHGTAESRCHSAVTAAVANVNDSPTGSVTINDTTPTQDQLLTAANTLADADGLGAISYTWQGRTTGLHDQRGDVGHGRDLHAGRGRGGQVISG